MAGQGEQVGQSTELFNATKFIEATHQDGKRLHEYQDSYSTRTSLSPVLPVVQCTDASVADLDAPQLNVEPRIERKLPLAVRDETTSIRNGSGNDSTDADQEQSPYSRSVKTSGDPIDMANPNPLTYEAIKSKGIRKMHKFTLYETQTRYYLVGSDITDRHFRMIQLDRTLPPDQLHIVEDEVVYTKKEMSLLLQTIEDGNRAIGGMKSRLSMWGLLGFIKFTESYYMVAITKRQQVAMIGGHYIYQIDGTELFPLTTSTPRFQMNKNAEETRFLAILNSLDLTQSFYFSYTYNITRTLQQNMIRARQGLKHRDGINRPHDYNDMFIWNHHLLSPAAKKMKNPYDWCIPIVHGFIDQSSVNVFGRNLFITLIARRSRFYAGARFLKRGANDLGFVANDVETEQIVADMLVTSFNELAHPPLKNPNHTSFVQHRGSIPLYWTQDNSGVSPKPAIDLQFVDPFYSTAALHFDNLFERYGGPIVALNLVKARERTPRESKLLVEYQNAINYLNQSLPKGKKILYRAYDMSRASKTRGQDVIGTLEKLAEEVVRHSGFFHNGHDSEDSSTLQSGVVRSNCIDCLDRTNAAQFVVGKRALACQLQALGVIAGDSLNYDTDAVNLYAHMFNDHGDTLASQYGGSHLVNTTDSYRKINNWQSHSRDMLESFKRYYHNSFFDSQRQEAYNLFLGNYIFASGKPMLWELPNDYYLHHDHPNALGQKKRRDYINWYTPEFLDPQDSLASLSHKDKFHPETLPEDWWHEYYRPSIISNFAKVFSYRLNSTTRYLPKSSSTRFDISPFAVRKQISQEVASALEHKPVLDKTERPTTPPPASTSSKRDVTVADSNSREVLTPLSATSAPRKPVKRITSLQDWLHAPATSSAAVQLAASGSSPATTVSSSFQAGVVQVPPSISPTFRPADKALMNQWTLAQFHSNSLHPSVAAAEAAEYERYIDHPLRMPLVVISDTHQPLEDALHSHHSSNNRAFVQYIERPGRLGMQSTVAAGGLPPMMRQGGDGESTELAEFARWLDVRMDPLSVTQEDGESKRYQAYRKWLKGKSLFKQSKVDPEFVADHAKVVAAV